MSDTAQGAGWWLASDGKWYPPQSAPAAPPPPPPVHSSAPVPVGNGLAVASLTLGIVGAVFGLVPLTFFIAWICGALALIFGGVGLKRARERAVGRGMAIAGTILGGVAVVLGVVGIIAINEAVDDLNRSFEEFERLLEDLD